jgi:glycosyltransferase involved in cell wall biosynthesis
VVVTYHTTDYEREKWGIFTKLLFKLGDQFGMRFSTEVIVVSKYIKKLVYKKYRRNGYLIFNGVGKPSRPVSKSTLERFDLTQNMYILNVGRLDPGKRQLDIIHAFNQANIKDWKLVLVGDVNEEDHYTADVIDLVEKSPMVTLTGFQSGTDLQELYTNAGFFVLASSHEGMPIALLEAISYSIPVLASDIIANREIGLPDNHLFQVGDIDKLSLLLTEFSKKTNNQEEIDRIRLVVSEKYDWNEIASQTMAVYEGITKTK